LARLAAARGWGILGRALGEILPQAIWAEIARGYPAARSALSFISANDHDSINTKAIAVSAVVGLESNHERVALYVL